MKCLSTCIRAFKSSMSLEVLPLKRRKKWCTWRGKKPFGIRKRNSIRRGTSGRIKPGFLCWDTRDGVISPLRHSCPTTADATTTATATVKHHYRCNETLSFLLDLDTVLKNWTPGKFSNIWQIRTKWNTTVAKWNNTVVNEVWNTANSLF